MSDAGRHTVTFDESAAGERLDRALAVALPSLTRSRVKALIEGRCVALAGGQTIEEPSRKVKTGDVVVVDIGGPLPSGYNSDSTRTYAVGRAPSAGLPTSRFTR